MEARDMEADTITCMGSDPIADVMRRERERARRIMRLQNIEVAITLGGLSAEDFERAFQEVEKEQGHE
jgi:hypothetical protein